MNKPFSRHMVVLFALISIAATGGEGLAMRAPSTAYQEMLPGERGRLPEAFLEPVVELFGLDKCDYERSWYVVDRAYADLTVANRAISCNVWPSSDRSEFAFSSSVTLESGKLPVVGYVSQRVFEGMRPKAAVIYMAGGPAGSISPGINDALPSELVRNRYAVIKLGYSGTRHGSNYPHPDFETAAEQLKEYVRILARILPNTPLVLMGESLGGQIVARSLDPDTSSLVSAVALVHPLLLSPDAALRNFRDNLQISESSDTVLTLERRCKNGARERGLIREKSLTLFSSFFPTSARDRDLASYLDNSMQPPILLAYGNADRRIGTGLVSKVRARRPNLDVLEFQDVDHTIEAPQARLITIGVDRLLLSSPRG